MKKNTANQKKCEAKTDNVKCEKQAACKIIFHDYSELISCVDCKKRFCGKKYLIKSIVDLR